MAERRAYLNAKFERTGNLDLDITIRGRQEVANTFYKSQGIAPVDIPSHLRGIDFTQPVEVVTVNRSKLAFQYSTPGAPQGRYYSFDPNVLPSNLGVSPYGLQYSTGQIVPKLQNTYMTLDRVQMLRSTSAPIMDTWSARGTSYYAFGGGTQWFSGNFAAFGAVHP